LLRVQYSTPDDGQRNCPKHVEFYSKNKFEKLVHLVGFIRRIHSEAIIIIKLSGLYMPIILNLSGDHEDSVPGRRNKAQS
jgi:hypothetical protein